MAPDQYAAMMDAMRELEARINATVAGGLAAVNVTIVALTDSHHKALLEQERRNSTFADRSRLEELTVAVSRHANQLAQLEERYDTIIDRLDTLTTQVSHNTIGILSGATNYLILVTLMLGSNLLVFILSHLVGK